MDLPNVSILMPTYNRRNFLPLIMSNLYFQTYPKNKLELVIIDDGKSPLFINDGEIKAISKHIGIPINYIRDTSHHYSIGEKRNKLVKLSKYKTLIFMDDDDIYRDEYIKYSVDELIKGKYGLVGSNQMIFVYPYHDFKITGIKCEAKRQIHEATMCFTKKYYRSMPGFKCEAKRQIHEATMCFTKKYYRSMPGFNKTGVGEGSGVIDWNDKKVGLTDVSKCMICIAHKNNTVDKELFIQNDIDSNGEINPQYKQLISSCLGIPLSPLPKPTLTDV